MNRVLLRIRNYSFLGILALVLGASVTPYLEPASADETVPEVQSVVADVDIPETNPGPERPQAQGELDIGCALRLTPVAFLDQGGGAGVDFPNTALTAEHGQFHGDGFLDVGVPRSEGGQENEVSVGDQLVIYAVLVNRSADPNLSADCLAELPPGGVNLNIESIDVMVSTDNDPDAMGTTVGDATSSVDWPLSGEENIGVMPPGSAVFSQFNWEVPSDFDGGLLEEFLFTVMVNLTCDNPGSSLCNVGGDPASRSQRYPDKDNQTLGGTLFAEYYGSIVDEVRLDPLIEVIGPRAAVEVTVTPPGGDPTTEQIVVAPFTDVTYTISLTSRADGVDAIRSIDDGDGTGAGQIPECDIDSPNWTLTDPGGPAVNARSLDGAGDGIVTDEVVVCNFTRTITPALTNEDSIFRLQGALRLFNADNRGGIDTLVNISAPQVLVTEASIEIVKQIVDPDTNEPVPPDTEFQVGDTITYRVTVTNTGQNPLENILVVDSLTGPLSGFGGVLEVDNPNLPNDEDGSVASVRFEYTVTAEAARPLVNTVTVTANPVGAPLSFQVGDSGAATANIAEDEFSVRLILAEVQQPGAPAPIPFDNGNRATFPRPGATLFYQVEYCNLGLAAYRDLRFINNTPTYIDTPRTFVDVNLGDGNFAPGCYLSPGTAFEYTVPDLLDEFDQPNPNYNDPVTNSIDVRAIAQGGTFLFAEDTLTTNVINDSIEIDAVRYSLLTGEELGENDAVLRGETLYYHVDIKNNSGTCVQGVVVRNYVRSASGALIPGSPFEIPLDTLDWGTGIPGQIDADDPGSEDDTATSRSVPGGNRISFTVTGDTPDPIDRVFEVFAETDCSGNPLDTPFLDRDSVFSDISDVQVNSLIQFYNTSDLLDNGVLENPLDTGFLLDTSSYVFSYDATNVGASFEIEQLTYCVLAQPGANCDEQAFPGDAPNFFTVGFDTSFLPFQNRSDISSPIDVIATPEEGEEAFSTQLRVQVILRGEEGGNNVTVRTVVTFLLLSTDFEGEISADENNDGNPDDSVELVRGDGPVPIQYSFRNVSGSNVNEIQVFNLSEVGSGPGFGTVPLPGFDDGTQYELCPVSSDTLLVERTLSGTCNFTYRSYLPGGEFNIEILIVGRRTVDDGLVFGFDNLQGNEIDHIEVEKTTPAGTVSAGQSIPYTIEVRNNSRYQRLDFASADGILDEFTAPLAPGSEPLPTTQTFLDQNPATTSPNGFGGLFLDRATPDGPTVMIANFTLTPESGELTSVTNTITATGTSFPPDPPPNPVTEVETGLVVSATDSVTTLFACPITLEGLYGRFVTNDIGLDPILQLTTEEADTLLARHNALAFANLDINNTEDSFFEPPTVGEGQTIILRYPNQSGSPIFIDGLTDELFEREVGAPINLNADVRWPDPSQPGYLLPGEAFEVIVDLWLRPSDLESNDPIQIFEWDVTISLTDDVTLPPGFEPPIVPPGCEEFSLFWFFGYDHPLQVSKARIGDGQLVPGDEIEYDISFSAVSDYIDVFVQRVDDSYLQDNLQFIRDDGAGPGRLNPDDSGRILTRAQDGNPQNVYVVSAIDAVQGILNIGSVTGYMPIDLADTAYPPSWQRDGVANVIGPGNPIVGEDFNLITPTTPLIIELEAGAQEVAAGGQFDINVGLRNTSGSFGIENVTVGSVNAQFLEGLSVASSGLTQGGLTLDPAGSVNYQLTDPYYSIPFDFTGEQLTICATATGTLTDADETQVAAEEACITITVVPPALDVVKQVYQTRSPEGVCTQLVDFNPPEPDEELEPTDRVFIVEALQQVYFGIEISNNSENDVFTIDSFEDIVGDSMSTDLSAALEADFLAKTGGTRDLQPGQSFIPCIEYTVPADAIALPALINEVTLNVSIGDGNFQVIDTVQMEVQDPNVSITKSTNQNIAFPGDIVRYEVVIRNRNLESALLIDEFYDTLISPRLTDVSYIASCEVDYDPSGPNDDLSTSPSCNPAVTSVPLNDARWTWPTATVGLLPPDTVARFIYEYEVLPSDPDPLINRAGVIGKLYDENWVAVQNEEGTGDLIAQDATQAAIAVTDSQLVVRKEAIRSAVSAGTPADYNIVITNIGETPVTNIVVIDCYPTVAEPCDLTEEPFDENGVPNPDFGGEILTGELLPESAQQTLRPSDSVRITRNTIGLPTSEEVAANLDLDPFINTVYVSGVVVLDEDGGITEPVATATDSAIVDILVPGLQVEKFTADATYSIGDTVTYTIRITNTGEQPLTIISAQDIVPGDSGNPVDVDGFTFCDDPDTDFTIGAAGDQLEAGETICATVDIAVPAPLAGESEFINTVRVTAEVEDATIIDSASETVDVRATGLLIEKTGFATETEANTESPDDAPLAQTQDGASVWYRLKIINGGATGLAEVRVSDDNPAFNGGDTLVITDFTAFTIENDNGDNVLDPGEAFLLPAYEYVADFEDTDPQGDYTNTASVVGVEVDEGSLTESRTASYTINIERVSLDVTKVACLEITEGVAPTFPDCVQDTTFARPGDFVWYQITFTNGSARVIDAIAAVDTRDDSALQTEFEDPANWDGGIAGRLEACTAEPCPQAVFTYRGTNPIPSGQPNITNTVSVTANEASDSEASATVTIVSGDLLVTIVELNGRVDAPAGTVLTFDITVTNLSTTETMNNIEVTVPLIGPTPLTFAPLAPAETSAVQTLEYTVDNADTSLDFVAQATGTLQGSGFVVNDTDTWNFVRSVVGFSASKTADVTTAIIGDTVTYTITVRNTSSGSTQVENLSVTDSLLPEVAATFTDTTLDPGEVVSRDFTYEVQPTDGNPVINNLLVTGSIEGEGFTVRDAWEVFIPGGPNGEILVRNVPSRPSLNVGESVVFTYEVCNLSDVQMTDVTMTDDDGPLSIDATILEPDTCASAARTVTATEADGDSISRTVTGTGDVGGETVSQQVTRTVEVLDGGGGDGGAELRFDVVATPANVVEIGGTVDIQFLIQNTGDAPLTIESFTGGGSLFTSYDPDPVGRTIAAGGSLSVSGVPSPIQITAGTPDPLVATWTVTASDDADNAFEQSDGINIRVLEDADIDLVLSFDADVTEVLPGGTVNYTYTVFNNSETMLAAVLQDRNNGCDMFARGSEALWTEAGATIMPGATATATAACQVSDSPTGNTVTHTIGAYIPPNLDTADVIDELTISTPIGSVFGDLELEILNTQPSILQAGSSANLVYRLANPSTTVTVTGITLETTPDCDLGQRLYFDAEVGGTSVDFDGTLEPGEEVFVFCEYTVLAADFNTLTVQATASADGIDDVTAVRNFSVIDADFDVSFRALTGSDGVTAVEAGQIVAFEAVITNTGQSELQLPVFSDDSPAITSSVLNSGVIFQDGDLGTASALYNLFSTSCDFPLAPEETCTVAGNATTGGLMTYTVPQGAPNPLTVNFGVMLQEVDTGFDVPMVVRTWELAVGGAQAASMQFVNFSATAATNPVLVGDTINIRAGLTNNGSVPIDLQSVTLEIREDTSTAVVPSADSDIFLTGAPRQQFVDDGSCLPQSPMNVARAGAPLALPFTFNVGDTLDLSYDFVLTADPDCAQGVEFVLRANGIAVGQTITQEQVIRITTGADPFDTIGGDGQNLDPNALDPTITKTLSPETVFPGESGTFTITVTNGSTSTMSINLIDPIAAAFTVDGATSTVGTAAIDGLEEVPGVEVSVLGIELIAGQTMTVTINFTVGADVEIPSLITNTACAANGDRPEVCASVEVPVGGTADGTLPTTGIGSLEPTVLREAVGAGLATSTEQLITSLRWR